MHMTDLEWTIIQLGLEDPDSIADMLPTMDADEIEARCMFLTETRDFDDRDMTMRKIIEASINNSKWHKAIQDGELDYNAVLDLVDAAWSLEDRFAARFPVEPSDWFQYIAQGVDGVAQCH